VLPAPCFGDQPLLGADDNGIYISTNELGFLTFNGAQIYAISKVDLENGVPSTVVHLANIPLAEGIAASLQPATSPTAGAEPSKGTEYFMSSLNFIGASDNRIAVWALTNTSSLSASSPRVRLQHVLLTTKVYEEPFPARLHSAPSPEIPKKR
jgi:hypothetical protein